MAKHKKGKHISVYLMVPLIIFLLIYSSQIRDWIEPLVHTTNEVEDAPIMTTETQIIATPPNIPDSFGGESNLYRITANEYLSLRDSPSKDGDRLAKLPAGEVVQVLERNGCYYKVQADNLTGYVLSGYLESVEQDTILEKLSIVNTSKQNYSYDEMIYDIGELSKRYSTYMTVDDIGTTYDGRDIKVIVVGDDEADVNILIHAGIHGREHMTVMLVMKQLEFCLHQKAQGVDDTWLNNVRFHIIPMLNPDGIMISQLGAGAIRDKELKEGLEVIRQNDIDEGVDLEIDEYFAKWKDNVRGVDLNLNFDANWDGIELSKRPSYAKYKGESIESEEETQAIVAYTKANNFDATLSYHAYGSGYYWYFGQTGKLEEDTKNLGHYIEDVSGYASLSHTDGTTNGGGGYKDWVIEKLNIPSLTIEIGSTPCPLFIREWPMVWECNKYVWKATADWALKR